jgi:hypothetical protein
MVNSGFVPDHEVEGAANRLVEPRKHSRIIKRAREVDAERHIGLLQRGAVGALALLLPLVLALLAALALFLRLGHGVEAGERHGGSQEPRDRLSPRRVEHGKAGRQGAGMHFFQDQLSPTHARAGAMDALRRASTCRPTR